MTTATLLGTRAILIPYAPTTHRCESCGAPIVGKKGRRPAVIVHIYEAGCWVHDLWCHVACYQNQYGPVIDRGKLPSKSRTRWS